MFVFDLPFLFICGIVLGTLTRRQQITLRANWFLGLILLFIFQTGGIMLWFNVIPGSKEYMIIPFNFLGMTVDDFEPLIAAFLFGLEPPLMIIGEYIGLKQAKIKEH
ncbi:MAG: hypothetical protein ACFFDT_21140 [Candidatus Hodarchaeota archaeon]